MGRVWMKIDPYPPWKPFQPITPWIVYPESNVKKAAAPYCKPRPVGLNARKIRRLLRQAGTQHWEYFVKKGQHKPKTSRQLRYMLRNRLPECIRSMTPREPPPNPSPDPYGLTLGATWRAERAAAQELSTLGPAMLTGPSP